MMTITKSRYSANEAVERAEEIYNQRLRSQVEAGNLGRYIAIDVDSGDYEMGDNYHAAARVLLTRNPDAALAVLRIGYAAVGRIGGRTTDANLRPNNVVKVFWTHDESV